MDKITYINILEDTLIRKVQILEELIILTSLQENYIMKVPVDIDEMEITFTSKNKLIENLNKIDEGFEKIYDRVKNEISVNRIQHKEKIIKLQELIKTITMKSSELQSKELNIKKKIDMYLYEKKKEIKAFKLNSNSVSSYYKNMSNNTPGQSFFLDKKK